ncbi:MAG: hypothetical protein K6G61_10530 [Solobacterium sp.]|nr:hypothetical protein [Solobacterium sp.]
MNNWMMIILSALLCGGCGLAAGEAIATILPENAGLPHLIILAALILVIFYMTFLIQTAIHEGGHLVFGRLSGYSFVSYRFADLMWKRENGRVAFRRFSLTGTAGQCLMEPPGTVDDDVPFVLYNMGGVIANAVTAVLFFLAGSLCSEHGLLWAFWMMLAIHGIQQALMNGLPFITTPINNDAKNTLELRRNRNALRPYLIQLKVTALASDGVRMKDMPEEWFKLPAPEEMSDALSASVGLMAQNRLMDEHRFHEAAQLCHILTEEAKGLLKLHQILLKEDLVFLRLLNEDPGGINEIRTKTFMNEIRTVQNSLSVIRTEFACALFADDTGRAYKLLKLFEKTAQNYPYTGEIETERELIRYAQGYRSCMKKEEQKENQETA